jgi:peptidoglycan/xylan/chitin deacetylase (PgdA/CDA1 family)
MARPTIRRPLVLCYHAASATWAHALSVPGEEIAGHVSWLLGRGYRPGGAEDVIDGRRGVLHVTFDDAFASITQALPLLESLGLRATVFVCSGLAEEGRVFDVPELTEEAGAHPEELRTLGWEALREVAARGHEIGSHTVSHPHLPTLSDEEVRRELCLSKERIESEVGRPCRFVAYPYGDHDARVREAAREAGYIAGFGLPGDRSFRDPYLLPRVAVWRGNGRLRLRLKASPAGHALSAWRRGGL